MSGSSYRILVDENVERQAARYLAKRGHDVELVVDVLGDGTSDGEIISYAEEESRLVLTSDPDFLSRGYPTLFQEDDKMSAFEVAKIVDEVGAVMSQSDITEAGSVKLLEAWL